MSTPFYRDFDKKTKDFWKRDKYDLGKAVEIKSKFEDNELTFKVSDGDKGVSHKATALLKRPRGTIEFTEDQKKGIQVETKFPQFFRNFDWKSKHSNAEAETTLDLKREDSYWNAGVSNTWKNAEHEERSLDTKVSFAVGDDSMHVAVGGEVVIRDEHHQNLLSYSPKFQSYSLGFLYTPTPASSYSVIYTPDSNSSALEYSFTLFKKYSDSVDIAAKADGKVDTKLTAAPPVFSFGGGYKNGGHYLQGFFNTKKEYGVSYNIAVSTGISVNVGVSSFLEANKLNTRLGYKFAFC